MWDEIKRVFSSLKDENPPKTRPYIIDISRETPAGALSIVRNNQGRNCVISTGKEGVDPQNVQWLPWQEGEIITHQLKRSSGDYWFVTAALSGCSVGVNKFKHEIFHINCGYDEIPGELRETSDILCPLRGSSGSTLSDWAEKAGVRSNPNSKISQYGSIKHTDPVPFRPARDTGPKFLRRARPAKPSQFVTDLVRATVIGLFRQGDIHLAYQDISETGAQLCPWYKVTTVTIPTG